ncbi:hypothetical protein [Caldalkalibacillus salinus]|uniref:hypothetical protein n=1 Tax=Caldalkalibacillus salinus TaxID=2803787 RepID=UPI0019208D72|nr:hypothetical protein [Caldalkalibacillus salinus]
MIKIKNPYSKKRFTLKEEAQKKFTRIVIPWINKIPLKDDWNAKRRFIPQSLNRVRIDLEYQKRRFRTNDIPKDVQVNLLSMRVAEYIPIENIDKLNKGLKRLFKVFKPKWYTNEISRIDDFCREVKQSIHGSRWSLFGNLVIDEKSELNNYVKQIRVNGTQISSSSVIIEFVIEPSDNYKKAYKELIDRNVEEEKILTPKLKQFLTHWGSRTPSNTMAKEKMVEDLLLELKWRTLKEINKYFDLYFYDNKLIPPSIEVYKISEMSCKYKYGEDEDINQFWDSIGMRDSHYHEISKEGHWQLFANENDYLLDSSVKLTCNEIVPKKELYNSIDSQMVFFVEELALNLLPMLVMRNYTLGLSKKIAEQQTSTFKSIKKAKPKYKKLINIRYELEQNLQILKRFKNEMGESEFDWMKAEILSGLRNFEPARPRFHNKPWGEMIVDNTSYLIERTDSLSKNFVQIIDDTVRLLEIKTNNSLRKRTFWLTIFTVILSILATFIAATSLYLQLSSENQQEIKDSLSPIFNLFM